MTSFRSLALAMFGLCVGVVVACLPATSQRSGSRTEWYLMKNWQQANLLSVLPGQSVSVCTQVAKPEWVPATEWAIEQWARAAGRWGYFKLVPCEEPANLKIRLRYPTEGEGNPLAMNYYSNKPGVIVIGTGERAKGDYLKAVMLHEIGHSWGLCDMYARSNPEETCSDIGDGVDNSELMGQTDASKLALTGGDAKALLRATTDQSLAANVQWAKVVQANPDAAELLDWMAIRLISAPGGGLRMAVGVPTDSVPRVCLWREGMTACASGDEQVSLRRVVRLTGRDVFLTLDEMPWFRIMNKVTFLATLDVAGVPRSLRFVIQARN